MNFSTSDARTYAAKVRWQFARSMPEWPHWYTVKDWRPELSAEFEAFCALVLRDGIVMPWPAPPRLPRYHFKYLILGNLKYWPLGATHPTDRPARAGDPASQDLPLDEFSVINRAIYDPAQASRTPTNDATSGHGDSDASMS